MPDREKPDLPSERNENFGVGYERDIQKSSLPDFQYTPPPPPPSTSDGSSRQSESSGEDN